VLKLFPREIVELFYARKAKEQRLMNRLNKIPNKVMLEKTPIKKIIFKEVPHKKRDFVKKNRYGQKMMENYKTQ